MKKVIFSSEILSDQILNSGQSSDEDIGHKSDGKLINTSEHEQILMDDNGQKLKVNL